MLYQFDRNYERVWNDEISCICWIPKMSSRKYSLSKKKLLKYFSELNVINNFHMFLLDNLSNIGCLYYYLGEDKLIVELVDQSLPFEPIAQRITIKISKNVFDDIVTNSTVEQY